MFELLETRMYFIIRKKNQTTSTLNQYTILKQEKDFKRIIKVRHSC